MSNFQAVLPFLLLWDQPLWLYSLPLAVWYFLESLCSLRLGFIVFTFEELVISFSLTLLASEKKSFTNKHTWTFFWLFRHFILIFHCPDYFILASFRWEALKLYVVFWGCVLRTFCPPLAGAVLWDRLTSMIFTDCWNSSAFCGRSVLHTQKTSRVLSVLGIC